MSTCRSNISRAVARTFVLLPLIAVVGTASAQTASSNNVLPPIVVTASRIEQPQTDALPHTTVITAEDIRNSQAADLPSLLRREAGIQLTQNGGPGQSTSLFMRGAQPAEALILVDGVPVRRQGFSAAPALEHILPDQIDHIEIVRGNVSAIYGSSAIGGVIQIFTKQGAGQSTASLSAEVGSRGTRQATGGLSGTSGDTRYALSLTSFRTDGFSANNTAQYPNENPDNNGDRNTSFSASVSHEWSKEHRIGVRAYGNDGRFTYDGGGFGAATDVNEGRSKQQSLAIYSKDNLTTNWSSTATVSQSATRTQNTSIAAFGYTTRDNSDTTLLQWTNEVHLSANWTLVGGLDAGRERLDAFADYGFGAAQNNYARATSSLYSGLNGKIAAHQLQLNIRRDRVGGSGSDVTGYLGYGFALTPSFKFTASASTAFSAPTLTQLYDAQYGNPALKAERARSYEIGAQYAISGTLVRATLFDTRTREQFGYDGAFKTINIDKARNQGLELSATARIMDADVGASLTFQNPKNDVTDEVLIRRAKTLASLSLSKSFGEWNVGTNFQYTGSRPDTDFVTGNKKQLSGYSLANFNARYQMTRNVSLLGRIDNVFDRDYQTAYGYNQPPRGIFAGLNWQQ